MRLRLATARAFVQVLSDGQGPAAQAADASLSLSASVQGLGPAFRLLLALRNEGAAPLARLLLAVVADGVQYRASACQLPVPLLVPALDYELQVCGWVPASGRAAWSVGAPALYHTAAPQLQHPS